MISIRRFALPGLMLTMGAMSPATYGTCWEAGAGPTAIYRNPTVAAEFKEAPLVITGRVTAARKISEPDDPEGYAWTVYSVQVLEVFKGTPQPTIQLTSENTTARFPMDTGKTYLLFVRQSSMVEMAGQERLPTNFIDNCGNSAAVEDAKSSIKAVRRLSKSR